MRRSRAGVCLLLGLIGISFVLVIRTTAAENGVVYPQKMDYRGEMIRLVWQLSAYAKNKNRSFQVVGNNGLGLCDPDGMDSGLLDRFTSSVDGILVESLLYGWDMKDDVPTPPDVLKEVQAPLNLLRGRGKSIFAVDYCYSRQNIDACYQLNAQQGRVPLAADSRNLDTIPQYPQPIHRESSSNIQYLSQVHNFLILLNPHLFADKESYLAALGNTNYDLLILDLYFNDDELTPQDISRLQVKYNGGKRLVFAYMSIGEAEEYRPYWGKFNKNQLPAWVVENNPQWQGNYKVKYWDSEWKKVLIGSNDAYLDKIVTAGFNGVFLDVIDAYQFFGE